MGHRNWTRQGERESVSLRVGSCSKTDSLDRYDSGFDGYIHGQLDVDFRGMEQHST